jgi:Transglycosylase SLT domain
VHSRVVIRSVFLLVFFAMFSGAVTSASGDCDWAHQSAVTDSLRRQVRLSRMALDPAAIYIAEAAYSDQLTYLSTAVSTAMIQPPVTEADRTGYGQVVHHLLAAREPLAESWLIDFWPALADSIDPDGETSFWVGLSAYEQKAWIQAAACFDLPTTAQLQTYADWLRIKTLTEIDSAAAGAAALGQVRRAANHLHRDLMMPLAAVHLLGGERYDELRNLLSPWLQDRPTGAADGWTCIAETYRREGDKRAFDTAFQSATSAGQVSGITTSIRRSQLEEILTRPGKIDSDLIASCLITLAKFEPSAKTLTVFGEHSIHLTDQDSLEFGLSMLGGLYGKRNHDLLLQFAAEWQQSGLPLQQRLHLTCARVGRRRGDLALTRREYRFAAHCDDPGAISSHGENILAATALWELGRELEDAGLWSEAAATFEQLNRRFPANEHSRTAGLRQAIALHQAKESDFAVAILDSLSQAASPRQLGGPYLWRALLDDTNDPAANLTAAAAERYPGYFALRAREALRSGLDPSDAAEDSLFWRQLAAEIRDPSRWRWPASKGSLPPETCTNLLELIEGNPSIEAGILFRAYGYNHWANRVWTDLAGLTALDERERSAFYRGLGYFYRGIRLGFKEMDHLPHRYPVAYTAAIDSAASRFNLSPAFLLAVMRQESLLEPIAKSSAGAIGLMQLMPATAARLCDSLSLGEVNLEYATHNILLGAAHLAELLTKTGGSIPMALASYNGGLHNADRWLTGPALTGRTIDWDLYIESISYGETRRYVKSVLMHYWSYLECYPES